MEAKVKLRLVDRPARWVSTGLNGADQTWTQGTKQDTGKEQET